MEEENRKSFVIAGAQMMARGQLIFPGTALTVSMSSFFGASLTVWISHVCTELWGKSGFSGTPLKASYPSCQETSVLSRPVVTTPGKPDLSSAGLFR